MTTSEQVRVYWRPGCGFCAGLLRALEREGLATERINIWDDEHAAEFVRSVAQGNETVPTVQVGSLALVNPSASEVMRAVGDQLPHLLPAGYEPPVPGRVARTVMRMLGGTPRDRR